MSERNMTKNILGVDEQMREKEHFEVHRKSNGKYNYFKCSMFTIKIHEGCLDAGVALALTDFILKNQYLQYYGICVTGSTADKNRNMVIKLVTKAKTKVAAIKKWFNPVLNKVSNCKISVFPVPAKDCYSGIHALRHISEAYKSSIATTNVEDIKKDDYNNGAGRWTNLFHADRINENETGEVYWQRIRHLFHQEICNQVSLFKMIPKRQYSKKVLHRRIVKMKHRMKKNEDIVKNNDSKSVVMRGKLRKAESIIEKLKYELKMATSNNKKNKKRKRPDEDDYWFTKKGDFFIHECDKCEPYDASVAERMECAQSRNLPLALECKDGKWVLAYK